MTKEELAKMLDGCEYGHEVTTSIAKTAKESGLVIVYGASDDLMEFDGAIRGEIGCYEGGHAYITPNGLFENECDDDECPYFDELKKKTATITAQWDSQGYSWTYATNIPHAEFDVMEDGEKYCRGIVFDKKDIKWFMKE